MIDRKLAKSAVMTKLYGSKGQSRRKKYLEIFVTRKINNAEMLTKNQIKRFKHFTLYLDFHLITWFETTLPEALFLSTLFKTAFLNNFTPPVILHHMPHGFFNQWKQKNIQKRFFIKHSNYKDTHLR